MSNLRAFVPRQGAVAVGSGRRIRGCVTFELRGRTSRAPETEAACLRTFLDGSRGLEDYELGSQSPVSGNGSAATPYTQTTTFFVTPEAGPKEAEITETTTYVNGQPQFTSTYTVKNIGPEAKIYARALYAGDLY